MRNAPPGNTLQPTALVHEAYLKLVGGPGGEKEWENRAHFFGTAAEAMRQTMVEYTRRKYARKRGSGRVKIDVEPDEIAQSISPPSLDIIALNDALEKLERDAPEKAAIAKLRYFAGLTREEAAEVLGMSLRTCDRHWQYVVARLHREMGGQNSESGG